MAQHTALPMSLPPRLISREAAAAYVNVSPTTFDQLVADGRMPQPKMLGRRRLAWDVKELDRFIDALPKVCEDSDHDKTWSDVDVR
ncbi:MAG: hypothetical protein QOF19_3396 [Alphaproteobacteria bacterium]|jgi:excisionase family DNA binding protein|nr:hypothetical protein [Alphaproteobacteria bacterium]